MWIRDTRRQDSRDLRYPTNLTDAEWQIIACHLPDTPSNGHGTGRNTLCWMAYCLSYARALHGAACFPIFRHGKPSTDGLLFYATEASFRPLITPSSSLDRSRQGAGRGRVCCRDQQPICENHGGRWTVRLRCREEGHGGKNGMPWSIPMAVPWSC